MRSWLLALLLTTTPVFAVEPSDAEAAAQLDASARMLSRYPAGEIPVEAQVLGAIATLGDLGTRAEIPLLANLVRNERLEIRTVSIAALEDVRSRLRSRQRVAYAADLVQRDDPQGPTDTSRCVAYAQLVIGDGHGLAPRPEKGDAERLLRTGQPHKALAAAAANSDEDSRFHEAIAREELGDVRGAVVEYAELLAEGNETAERELDAFGVDTERLLLGLLSMEDIPVARNEARVLDILVRKGSGVTVGVLAERAMQGHASDRATATDALVRMLDTSQREQPLAEDGVRSARTALTRVSIEGPLEIREIAAQGL